MKYDIINESLQKRRDVMARLVIGVEPSDLLKNAREIDKMTNELYISKSIAAGKMIDKNNRMYSETYKKAGQYLAR